MVDTVWPRMIRACVTPGCLYVESRGNLSEIHSCPVHGTFLTPVIVEPVRAPS